MENLITATLPLVTAYGLSVAGGIAILIIGWIAASWVCRCLKRTLPRWRRLDPMLVGFLAELARYAVIVFTLVAVLNQFGVATTSLIAVLGAAGLAVGLAIQGTLAHLAGGVMLLLFRPFRAGDTINVGGITGQIVELELFTTTLTGPDGVRIIMPNGKIWGETIQNFSQSPTRRFEFMVTIDHRADLEAALAAALDVMKADPRVLTAPAPQAVADGLSTDGIVLAIRGWTQAASLADARSDTAAALKRRFAEDGIALAHPLRLAQIAGGAADGAATAPADRTR